MDATTLNARIYAGRAKAAKVLGIDYSVFRPLAASAPLGNQVATIKAAFNAGDNSYKSPNMPGDAYWYGDFDGRVTQPGDYLVHSSSPTDIKYIAAQQSLLPILCVECNRSIKVSRQQAPSSAGVVGYGGAVPSNMVDILGSTANFWPASILFGGKSNASLNLPEGVKNKGWLILLPSSVPVVIKATDIITDDQGRRFSVEGAELSDTGWRLQAQEVHV